MEYLENGMREGAHVLTFSTSDSHHRLKPNITSEILPEENHKSHSHSTIGYRPSCDSHVITHLKSFSNFNLAHSL